jgi:hypothetical protein
MGRRSDGARGPDRTTRVFEFSLTTSGVTGRESSCGVSQALSAALVYPVGLTGSCIPDANHGAEPPITLTDLEAADTRSYPTGSLGDHS